MRGPLRPVEVKGTPNPSLILARPNQSLPKICTLAKSRLTVQMNSMLTERQQSILDFLRTFQETHGVPPSTRAIQRQFQFASQNAVMCHLRALATKGMIEQLADRSWGLRAREIQTHLFELPVYGSIPAGLPSLQEQSPDETLGVDPAIFGLPSPPRLPLWALRVSGDSMVEAHILDGDLAVLERREPRPGDIIAALVDETSTTLKRLVYVDGKPVLRPANKRYADIHPQHDLACQGVLVGLIRRQSAVQPEDRGQRTEARNQKPDAKAQKPAT